MAYEALIISLLPLLLVLALVEGVLKGIALWKCGRSNHLAWFIVIFIFNTIGILPLIYLLLFREGKSKSKNRKVKAKKKARARKR